MRYAFEPDAVTDQLNAVYDVEESRVDEAVMSAQLGSVEDEAW